MTAEKRAAAPLRRLIEFEAFCTPIQFLREFQKAQAVGDAALVDQMATSVSLRYLRSQPIISNVVLKGQAKYARMYGEVGAKSKRLIIGFTGRVSRLMMPTPILLQNLPAQTDIMLLYDVRNSHYRTEVFDGKCSLYDLVDVLQDLTAPYDDVIAIGASGGGLPATRFAKLAGLRRGFSFGGRSIDDTLRALRGEPLPSAYDPICACDRRGATQVFFHFSEDHTLDAQAAARAACCTNAHLVPLRGRNEHTLLWTLTQAKSLNRLLTLLFEGGVDQIREYASSC